MRKPNRYRVYGEYAYEDSDNQSQTGVVDKIVEAIDQAEAEALVKPIVALEFPSFRWEIFEITLIDELPEDEWLRRIDAPRLPGICRSDLRF